MFTAHAVAVQGIGYGALLVALQGFADSDEPVAVLPAGGGRRAPYPVRRGSLKNSEEEEILLLLSIALQMLE